MTPSAAGRRLLEIRTYRLKPGAMQGFRDAMREVVVPMLQRHGMDVVAHGRSDHEAQICFLVRSYKDRSALESEQSDFYASQAWTQGPRALLVDRIDTYVNTLLWCSEEGVEAMRTLNVDQTP